MRAACVIALAAVVSAAAQQPERPVFRAGVDVFAVEASVLDRDGKPITDLTAQDFVVTVDGKPRRARSARFHHDDGGDAVTSAAAAPVPGLRPTAPTAAGLSCSLSIAIRSLPATRRWWLRPRRRC
jgi:hypothetical protein